jgi:hypothetical protein
MEDRAIMITPPVHFKFDRFDSRNCMTMTPTGAELNLFIQWAA